MDHIPRQIFGLSGHVLKIPYLGGIQYTYDGLEFASYPTRAGKVLQTILSHQSIWHEDLEFLQVWLFFGVLHECLSVVHEDWLAPFEHPDLPYHFRLSTLNWVPALRERQSRVGASHHELRKFDECLRMSTSVLNEVIESRIALTTLAEAKAFDRPDSPVLVLFSLQLILSSLIACRAYIFDASLQKLEHKGLQVRQHDRIINFLLQRADWNTTKIMTLETSIPLKLCLSYMQGRYFMFSHNRHEDHIASMSSKEVLSPKHTSMACACENLAIEEDNLLRRKASNPERFCIVSVDETLMRASGKMQVMEVTGDEHRYVAFSHVRAQCLGNTQGHSLPCCQLSFLQLLANSAVGPAMAIYIDTLSVPFQWPSRQQELRKIYTIFKNATAVIVLDQSLSEAYTNSDIDRLLRIRMSEWKSRLWTLREGLAARRLLFKFADGLHDISEMLERVPIEEVHLLFADDTSCLDQKNLVANLEDLEALGDDLKSQSSIRLAASQDVKYLLYATLRLGYLSQPLYRYFREPHEKRNLNKAVRIISRAYSKEREKQNHGDEMTIDRLSQLYASALQEGIEADIT